MDTVRIKVYCSVVLVEFEGKTYSRDQTLILICSFMNLEYLKLNSKTSLYILYVLNLKRSEMIHTSFFSIFFISFQHTPWRTGEMELFPWELLDGPKASIMPSTYHSASPPRYTILDVDANAMLFVGGLTGKLKVMCFSPSISVDNSWHDDFGQRQDTKL